MRRNRVRACLMSLGSPLSTAFRMARTAGSLGEVMKDSAPANLPMVSISMFVPDLLMDISACAPLNFARLQSL